jgi:hypothetical protein
MAMWESNQHDSDSLRPSDVSVYFLQRCNAANLKVFQHHVTVQTNETLHAIIVYGDVCSMSSLR